MVVTLCLGEEDKIEVNVSVREEDEADNCYGFRAKGCGCLLGLK